MCLAVPGKVLSVDADDPAFCTASVDFFGIRTTMNLAFAPDAVPRDVLVHVGFAISTADAEEAEGPTAIWSRSTRWKMKGLAPPVFWKGGAVQ